MVVLFLIAPSSSIWCNGSKTFSIPSMLRSPKYNRLASSNASCHVSCQRIATRINSVDTSWAYAIFKNRSQMNNKSRTRIYNYSIDVSTSSTSTPLCCRTLSTTSCAACLRKLLMDLHATRRGYIRACMGH